MTPSTHILPKEQVMIDVQQVLVGLDRSPMSEEVLRRAVEVARDKTAQLIIVHVIEPPFVSSPYLDVIDEQFIKDEFTHVIDRVIAKSDVEYMLFLGYGEPADAIQEQARKTQTDLVVLGAHGKADIEDDHVGSTAMKLVQRCHLPIIIVKRALEHSYEKMIAPTDLSARSQESILFAHALYPERASKYLYAADTISDLQAKTYHIEPAQRDRLREEMAEQAKARFTAFVSEVGGGAMVLIDYKASVNEDLLGYIVDDDADLLVLGSHGVESVLFSSTSLYLLQHAPMDVLVYVS
jgi:nucleotide-binding universal stress UspA family protein